VPVAEFVTGPKRNCLAPDELIRSYRLPAAAGPQQFAKVGTRNAMVIAVCSVALALWPDERRVAACVGSAGPTPLIATEAQDFAAGALDWDGGAPLAADALARFGELVSECARPIDDVRGTAGYRSHAVGVLGRRTLSWAWDAYAGRVRA
jgi:CO/xanthine dehydrogenase FAD-binding subunit